MNDSNNLELEIDLDERPAVSASERFNRAMQRSEVAVSDVSKRIGNSLDGVTKSLVKVTEFAGALTVVAYGVKELAGAITGATAAAARHAGAFDSILNTYRAARLALSPSIFTGVTIAAGVAAEAVLRLAHARRNLYEQEALQAARTGNTFSGAATLGALGRITGKDVSAFSGMSPSQISGYAVEFGGIVDPAARGQRANEVFGANAEQALKLFKTDIKSSVEAANELATAIDYKTRMALGRLTNDLAEPSRALSVIRDEFRSLAEQAKTGITVRVAVIYDKAVTRMGQSSTPRTPEEALADALAEGALGRMGPRRPSDIEFEQGFRVNTEGMRSTPGFTVSSQATGRAAGIRSQYRNSMEGITAELVHQQSLFAKLSQSDNPIAAERTNQLAGTIAALKARKLELENAVASIKAIDAVLDEFRKLVPVYNDVTGRVEMKTAYRQRLEWEASTRNSQLMVGRRDIYAQNVGTVLERDALAADQAIKGRALIAMAQGPRTVALNDSAGYNLLDVRGRFQSVERFQSEQQIGALGRQMRLENELGGLQAGPRGQLGAIDQAYQRRITYAQQVYDIEKGTVGTLAADARRQQEFDEARIDRISRIAQEERKRFDELKHSIEGLIDAGISGGRNMMQALGGMMRSLLLAPLKEFVATWAASALGGGSGRGQASAMGGMMAAPAMLGMGGGGGAPAMAGGLPLSYDPIAMMAGMGAPGGTSGFAGPVAGMGGGGGFGGLGGILNTGMIGSVRNAFSGTGSLSSLGAAATTVGSLGMAGGAALAGFGLQRRGLLGGAMTVGGGALAGAALGTFIMPGLGTVAGAAIGAGIGLGASLIRNFGFESDVDHARKLIRQVYGIDIAEKSVLQRIVEMAKQQFAGSISTAIYSPQVRELIELYSQTRGGSFFNAYTPRTASLANVNGILSQAPLYVNGSAYSFAGSVPGGGTVIGSGSPQVTEVRLSLDSGQTKSVLNGRATSLLVSGMIRG